VEIQHAPRAVKHREQLFGIDVWVRRQGFHVARGPGLLRWKNIKPADAPKEDNRSAPAADTSHGFQCATAAPLGSDSTACASIFPERMSFAAAFRYDAFTARSCRSELSRADKLVELGLDCCLSNLAREVSQDVVGLLGQDT
jgi:hypothetical protein